ncbi:uncharacterized protein LOC129773090 [Toxorhynchites rutilus septentrionalis]|uniref:uncharacterized protein LOC129773090 n=1 Tax=Toxorhynchites rutilus septentrionalis TaxID=329112 RepID=UPI0024789ABD|nr:uncharacterized protein LOC129773090 [Toxorhynchites rutilus septentrionalis]
MRKREMEQEKALLEKSLRKEQEHMQQMGQMRNRYQEMMAEIKKKTAKPETAAEEKNKEEKYVKENELSGSEDEEYESEEEYDTECEEEDPEGELENNEKKKDKKQISKKVESHGLGRQSAGPTKAQLAARNGSYEASNEACGYNDIENLVRLQECLKGPALENVRGQLLMPKPVPKVIEKLRQLYGRPEQLLQFHLRKVNRLEAPKSDKLETFIPFGNAVEQMCDHIEAAKMKEHLTNPLLLQSLLDKLPSPDKREWVRFKSSKKKVNLRTFSDFLARIVSEACEANACNATPVNETRSGKIGRAGMKEKGAVYSHSTLMSSGESTPLGKSSNARLKPCKACKRTDHRLRFCQDFRAMSFADRMKIVELGRLCKVCLNDHGVAPCKFKIRCNVEECQERHHPLLHPVHSRVVMNTHHHVQGEIMFRMIPVTLHHGSRVVKTLAFLDEGASITLVERTLTDMLGVEGVHEPLTITWTAGNRQWLMNTWNGRNSTKLNLWVSSTGSEGKLLLKAVQTVKQLLLPKQAVDVAEMSAAYRYLRDVPLSSYSHQRPGMLSGLNNLHAIAPVEVKMGQQGEPIAVRSPLCWAVYGPTKKSKQARNFVGYHQAVSNEDLHTLLRQQYALEESVVAVSQESKEEKRAREILERTTARIGDRFETGMLLKTDELQLPNSYPMTVRRMKQLEKRLEQTPELFDNVRRQIVEYLQKGYAHLATPEELAKFASGSSWFLPINIVRNPKKPEKVRLVWDAAATVDGVSLNSQLLTRPDLLTPLPKVICRFRERPIGFGGDLREMFHQIRIRESDKRLQLFVFRNSPNDAPSVYVMDVATFGSKCSPSQAQFAKNLNAMEFVEQLPEAAAAIVESHYVDDYFDSVDTIEEAVRRAKEVKFIHSKGGFEIRNWVSNSGIFLDELGEIKALQAVHFNWDKENGTERVLGIVWDPNQDEFSFSMEHRQDVKPYLLDGVRPTKRIVLSCVMGFFDPLGLLTPFTIHGKLVIQDLWRTGCDWDEVIDDTTFAKCYFPEIRSSSIESLELHIFTDASMHAYGCAAYFRAVIKGNVRCSLIMSRSKVSPLKLQSIPRLELMAAVLGARMLHTVKSNHTLHISRQVLWSDSQTVLSWIRSDQHKYKQFVAFRIGEIVELTSASDWRHVPSDKNIGDVVTKWGIGPPLDSNVPA